MISLSQQAEEMLTKLRAERRKLDGAIESLEVLFGPAKSIPPKASPSVSDAVAQGRVGWRRWWRRQWLRRSGRGRWRGWSGRSGAILLVDW